MQELEQLVRTLGHQGLPWEVAALLSCLALAWLLSWLAGRRHGGESVWFGSAIVDGLLFPLIALSLAFAARAILVRYHQVPLMAIAIPVLIALAGIRFIARILALVFPASGFARAVERVFSWFAWITAVLWIIGLLPFVMEEMDSVHFALGKSKLSLLNLVQGVLSASVVLMVALWVSAVLERRVLRDAVHDLSLRKAAANVIRAGLLLLGILVALTAAGFDLTALSVLGGALGVGLGLGLQKLASNYVSGFVILFERSLRIGDTVRVEGFEGVVADIKTRYTLIRANSGREAIVPNEKLITERVENLSLGDTRVLMSTEVAVGYDSDVDRVRDLLEDAAKSVERVIDEPAPAARLVNFGNYGLEFTLQFWIADPQNGQLAVKSDVNFAVLQRLRKAAIDIPYPQQVVHQAKPTSSATATTG